MSFKNSLITVESVQGTPPVEPRPGPILSGTVETLSAFRSRMLQVSFKLGDGTKVEATAASPEALRAAFEKIMSELDAIRFS